VRAKNAGQIAQVLDGEVQKIGTDSAHSDEPFRADWRNPAEYPPPDCDDMARLAWEFLRRNALYAQHVAQMVALPPGEYDKGLTAKGNACLDGMVCTPQAKPGETVRQYRKRVATESSGKKKGNIAKPQQTFRNLWLLEKPVPIDSPYDANEVQFVRDIVKMYRHKTLVGRRGGVMLHHNEALVRIRLDLPISFQLRAASPKLNKAAKQFAEEVERLDDGNLVSNANSRNKNTIRDGAHYWLRAYDASKEPKMLLDDSDVTRKRAQKSGPSEIGNWFREEGGTKTFERGVVEGYQSSAERMIDKKGYQKLLIGLEGAPKDLSTLTQAMSRMVTRNS
jgi:hypothetical protein